VSALAEQGSLGIESWQCHFNLQVLVQYPIVRMGAPSHDSAHRVSHWQQSHPVG
jgi:hypothetical protein